jgi:PPOX class probable F420-dependent enzyme
MDLAQALDFATGIGRGVLVTTRSNGRPQLSNISFAVNEGGVIRISITAERAKYRNLLREPWAALHVTREDFYAYAVIEGDVTLSAVAAAPDDATVDELVELYRAIGGEHDDWEDYRRAMVRDQRVVVRIAPTRAYGMLPE